MSVADSVSAPAAAATYGVLSLDGVVARVSVPADALLCTLLQRATTSEPPAVASCLHLCFSRSVDEPDLLSLVSDDVAGAVTVEDFLDGHATDGKRFRVVLRIALRCLCRIEPIICLVTHATTFGSVRRQFFATWHRRQQLPLDAGRWLLCYTDDSRGTAWPALSDDSLFMGPWLLHGALSPLPVRVREAEQAEEVEEARRGARREEEEVQVEQNRASATAASFPVVIRQLSGTTLELLVQAGTTVEQLKGMIEAAHSIPRVQQRLVFGGRQLEDASSMAQYNIRQGAVVHLVLKLC